MPRHPRFSRPETAGPLARSVARGPGRRALLTALAGLTAAGCTPARPAPRSGGPAPSTQPSTQPSTSTSPGELRMPDGLLLNWVTTGGIAGVHRQTLLYEDGTYTLSEEGGPSRTGHIPAEDAARVRTLLEEAGLGRQPQRSTGPGADRFQYRIAYDGHVVHRDETTLGEPLREVMTLAPVG